MRTLILSSLLLASVAATGCKKNQPEPAVEEVATTPKVEWSFGTADFNGSRAEGNTGTLSIPVSIRNNTENTMTLKAIDLQVLDATAQKACAFNDRVPETAQGGMSISTTVTFSCDYGKLPSSGDLSVKGHLMFELGGKDRTRAFEQTVPFAR